MMAQPCYLKAKNEGTLDEKIEKLEEMMNPCLLCPRKCRANRMAGEPGYCRAPYDLVVSSSFPHFGEEAPLVGTGGSGTIFFSHCNLRCVFCQNYEISIYGEGETASCGMTASLMLGLQQRGCHNINLVTPTHFVPRIMKALSIAIDLGLSLPLVYNCGGYESLEVIRLLDGIIDIYMPDIKFLDEDLSARFCGAPDYPETVRAALLEMERQAGDLVVDERGIAQRGLLIRHLVMPSCEEDTKQILRFIRDEVSPRAFVNIMAQYHPCHGASRYPEIGGRTGWDLHRRAVEYAHRIGLERATC
jgi:putative pyruvate formate lyase activating enzyme